MTSEEYKKAVTRVGLSFIGAGRFLGVEGRTAQRWGSGESRPPQSVAKLLRLMMHMRLSAAELDEVLAGKLSLTVKKQELQRQETSRERRAR
jgi:hypothetical protein